MAEQEQQNFSALHAHLQAMRTSRDMYRMRRGEFMPSMGFALDPEHCRVQVTKHGGESTMQLTAMEAEQLLTWLTTNAETIGTWAAEQRAAMVAAAERERQSIEAFFATYTAHQPR